MSKSILQIILAFLARRVIRAYDPVIVGVTGSVGKTSTRGAIRAVLAKRFSVRTAEKNYNNEIGLPLTILGVRHHGRNVLGWMAAFLGVLVRLSLKRGEYPEVLILEYGIDRPGDMDVLISIARPDVAVVTRIGDIPVHVEFFKDSQSLAEEKAKLISALRDNGYVVLNRDDAVVFSMRGKTKANIVSYGKSLNADVRIMHSELRMKHEEDFGDMPDGMLFKIQYKGKVTSAFLPHGVGTPQLYAAGAACAVGLIMKMDIAEIVDACMTYEPPPGRLNILRGIKNSFLIDDTYNAAPESMREALSLLRILPAKRKIAVLGDMLEIGRFSEDAHRDVGRAASEFVDILLTVGPRARFIGDEMKALRSAKRGVGTEKIFSFVNSISAGKMLQSLIRPGDLVLIKGSQGMRMERIVEEVMAYPEHIKKLLVRQEEYWKEK